MKSEVSFVELPFRQFVKMFPDAAAIVRKTPFFDLFMHDPHYIVRFRSGKIEIGYSEDDWQVQ